jgi:serine/threonine protein kinase
MKPGEQLPAGHMLDGRYRVHKVLGQGGMGRVYLANDTRLANRPVAAKEMIIGDGIAEKKAIEDFAREARVLAALSHPGIPNVIDYFAENSRHYLVMEFVAGGDLQAMLDKMGPGGKLPEPRVLRWARQILDVLSLLHSQTPPIIYRDLKPGNIMIDKDARAMLIDFGIARFLPPGGRGTQIGSVGYAPPEQYMGKVEPRSDLYSLAATMHHLLTGRDPQLEPPFSFPPLLSLNPTVSAKTADVVMRALDKDLLKRPATARDMMHALPDPGPEPKASGTGTGAAGAAPVAAMKTVVLDRPYIAPPPAPAAQSGGGRLGAQPSAAAGSARPSTSNSPTVVLSRPQAPPPPRPPAADSSRTAPPVPALPSSTGPHLTAASLAASTAAGVAKMRSLARSARAIAVRAAAKLPAQPTLFEKPPTPSSTAKTQDLSGTARVAARDVPIALPSPSESIARTSGASSKPAKARPAPGPSRPVVSPRGAAVPNPDASSGAWSAAGAKETRNGRRPGSGAADGPSKPSAWLIAGGYAHPFGIARTRTIIGRSLDGAEAPDIDLAGLKGLADRVSRRHAEIIKQDADYFIRDLGSLNGTYITGRGRLGRDQLYKLKDRDQVVFGSAKLEFRKD